MNSNGTIPSLDGITHTTSEFLKLTIAGFSYIVPCMLTDYHFITGYGVVEDTRIVVKEKDLPSCLRAAMAIQFSRPQATGYQQYVLKSTKMTGKEQHIQLDLELETMWQNTTKGIVTEASKVVLI